MSEKSAGAGNPTPAVPKRKAAMLSRTYLDALRSNDAGGAYRVAVRALEEGMSVAALYQSVVTPAMHELGRLWEKGAITVADEHLATALTHRVMAALRSRVLRDEAPEPRPDKPRAMFAAVEEEQHALGLRMAADLLEDAGYQTIYLGADVPGEALMQAIATLSPELLGLSATMPECAPRLEEVVARVRSEHPRLSLLVGGQATASRQVREVEPVNDLELLSERVRLR
ncbi:MAG: cobalamin B12-binding domain-containing protein [Solirubrobacterales bacterium]